jgi:hypothetical protein
MRGCECVPCVCVWCFVFVRDVAGAFGASVWGWMFTCVCGWVGIECSIKLHTLRSTSRALLLFLVRPMTNSVHSAHVRARCKILVKAATGVRCHSRCPSESRNKKTKNKKNLKNGHRKLQTFQIEIRDSAQLRFVSLSTCDLTASREPSNTRPRPRQHPRCR